MNTYTKEILELLKKNYEQIAGTGTYLSENINQMQSYWLEKYEDNLFHSMDANAFNAYGEGAGNEIGTGKIGALKSSSALTYNLFWNQKAEIIRPLHNITRGNYAVEFEKKFRTLRTSSFPAHLDAFLFCDEMKEAIACEMKMTEWIFNKPSHLRVSYLNSSNYSDPHAGDVFAEVAKKIIGLPVPRKDGKLLEYASNYKNYDASQMFKHAVALYRACDQKCTSEPIDVKKLTLLNCAWTIVSSDKLTEESRQKYNETWNTEVNEFDRFTTEMRPIKDLFKQNLGIDFDIRFCTFAELLSTIDKTSEELTYLKRYLI